MWRILIASVCVAAVYAVPVSGQQGGSEEVSLDVLCRERYEDQMSDSCEKLAGESILVTRSGRRIHHAVYMFRDHYPYEKVSILEYFESAQMAKYEMLALLYSDLVGIDDQERQFFWSFSLSQYSWLSRQVTFISPSITVSRDGGHSLTLNVLGDRQFSVVIR